MIKFHNLEDVDLIKKSESSFNVDSVLEQFTSFQFNSIIKEKPWKKFVDTFGVLK